MKSKRCINYKIYCMKSISVSDFETIRIPISHRSHICTLGDNRKPKIQFYVSLFVVSHLICQWCACVSDCCCCFRYFVLLFVSVFLCVISILLSTITDLWVMNDDSIQIGCDSAFKWMALGECTLYVWCAKLWLKAIKLMQFVSLTPNIRYAVENTDDYFANR